MINAPQLLADLTRLLKRLEDDLRQRIAEVAVLKAGLQAEWQAARDAERTAEAFESWADQVITQAGVHWLLSCVFLRFIEDNELVERPWLSGTPESGRLTLARDRHEAYFRERPLESDRDYLLAAFREAGTLPGLHTFFDETHNPVFRLGLSGDAAMALRQFWQQVDPNTGTLAHDFTDPDWNTRFLGDLYQDLSEATRKRYALLQTPEFVENFILDRTLTPAIREFGFREVRMIDPTCGSGHFLLGGFRRLVDEWLRHEPARNPRDIAQRALDAVAGVDINPFAVAISRFRLLVAALKVSGVHRLTEAPDFKMNVAIGDSLLHGNRFGLTATEGMFESTEHYAGTGLAHTYASEDLAEVQRILGRQYHAVVGNPPYIVVKDAALNAAYRKRYASCHMKYSLGAPFTERFFDLALTGKGRPAGFVGLITANSFMKREFGSKLIEQVLPRLDLTHVLDTSGAYIPGHGTPTVILLGRHRSPFDGVVRTVMGIKGEPSTPDDPAHGQVWSAIVGQIDLAGSQSEFVSVGDTPRSTFAKHPWSIGGGGVAELREQIEQVAATTLGSIARATGVMLVTGEDEVFVRSRPSDFKRMAVPADSRKSLVEGDAVRDWSFQTVCDAIYEYDSSGLHSQHPQLDRYFWGFRTLMQPAIYFGRTKEERGMHWREYGVIVKDKLGETPTITFAEVATHNHFVLDRGGKVFKQTAPVIKLPAGSSEDEHLGLLGLLNSSVACFWLKQVCFPKGGDSVGGEGARVRKTLWDERYAFNASNVAEFPLSAERPLALARKLDTLARDIDACRPASLLRHAAAGAQPLPTRASLDAMRDRAAALRRQAIAWQEELDWACYGLYDLAPQPPDGGLRCEGFEPPEAQLGERAFEIVLARRIAAGRETTTWFERHGSTPVTEIPSHWPETYRQVMQLRIDLIERERNIGLIERPEYKRRWNTPAWDELERAALRDWLLDRLEAPDLWAATADHTPQLTTVNRLADAVRSDAAFMQIAELYAGHSGFDLTQVVAELVAGESVPFLPVLRYTDTGLRKRAQWEDTWALQRREDAGEKVGKIPVPPKYQSKDYVRADFWRLRGGLDVPKERWVSYPGCERGADASLPIAWAGWSHLQQATALAAYYLEMKENEGWEPARLQPLLAGLLELVPWLEQWHNEIDPAYGERMGTYYRGFVNEEARALGFTLDDLRAWKPVVMAAKRGRKKASA
ncbi:MAG: BREX-2 system adenine-specific DNA-methyltransferase PglX [Gammaproteobacteria bacterium]|nr:BREX-2 system adenine-specific DNA-methyltransferase PglX [Gammaproteobacteria bacterium]